MAYIQTFQLKCTTRKKILVIETQIFPDFFTRNCYLYMMGGIGGGYSISYLTNIVIFIIKC